MRSTGIVNLTNPYVLGMNNINVFIQGIYIDHAVYTETNSTRITFPVDTLVISEEIDIVIGSTTPVAVTPSTGVNHITPRGTSVDLHSILDSDRIHTYSTLLEAVGDITAISIGDVVICKQRIAGEENTIILDAVDATTVTENEIDIITGDGIVSLVLRISKPINCRDLGLSSLETAVTNTAVLNRAIVLATTLATAVYVPGSTTQYIVKTGINLANETILYGDGKHTSFKLEDSSADTDNIFKAENKNNFQLKNFEIDGNQVNQSNIQYNIGITGCTDFIVEEICSINSKGNGIYVYDSIRGKITNNISTANLFHGIEIAQCSQSNITGNNCFSNAQHGIHCFDGDIASTGSERVIIDNNQLTNNLQSGLVLQGPLSNSISVQGNNIKDNDEYGVALLEVGNTVVNSSIKSLTQLRNNLISRNGFHGVYLFSCKWSQITGNIFDNNSQAAHATYSELFLDGALADGYSEMNSVFHNHFISTDTLLKSAFAIREASQDNGPNYYFNNSFLGEPVTITIGHLHPDTIVSDPIGAFVPFKKSGTYTDSGTGAQSSFTFPHGLAFQPSKVTVIPSSEDAVYTDSGAVKHVWYVTADVLNITVTYPGTVPELGTNNLSWYWSAEVIQTI
jgi:parallel beta-helix repeat protein